MGSLKTELRATAADLEDAHPLTAGVMSIMLILLVPLMIVLFLPFYLLGMGARRVASWYLDVTEGTGRIDDPWF